jgi:hypothetical protein
MKYSRILGPIRAKRQKSPLGQESWAALGPCRQRAARYQTQPVAGDGSDPLSDRFKLKFHRENREFAGYTLVVGKDGPKMKDVQPTGQGIRNSHRPGAGGSLSTTGSSVAMLASNLSILLGWPVVGQTELSGVLEFDLEYSRDDACAGMRHIGFQVDSGVGTEVGVAQGPAGRDRSRLRGAHAGRELTGAAWDTTSAAALRPADPL